MARLTKLFLANCASGDTPRAQRADKPRPSRLIPSVSKKLGMETPSEKVKLSQIELIPNTRKAKEPIARTKAKTPIKKKKTKTKIATTRTNGIARGAARIDKIAI